MVSGGSWLVKVLLYTYSLVYVSLLVQPGHQGHMKIGRHVACQVLAVSAVMAQHADCEVCGAKSLLHSTPCRAFLQRCKLPVCTIVRHTISAPGSAATFWFCSTANKRALASGHLLLCQATSPRLRM